MAKNKNREPVKPVEPESGSSDEETDAEEPETILNNTTGTNKPSSNPITTDSSDEHGSDSDSDSDPKPSDPNPITPSKRLAADAAKKPVAKKPKIDKNVDSVSNNKVLFQRVFNDDDEIVILNGMIEFETNKNVSPTADMDAFLDYIKKNLHVDVSKKQLQGKIRKLRNKYENNKGKDKSTAKPHEKALLELSEKVWGGHKVAGSSAIVNVVKKNAIRKGKATEDGKEEAASDAAVEKKVLVGNVVSSFGLSNEEKFLRIGAELFGGEEKIVGSDEWNKLEREEMVLTLKQLDVKRAKMKLVLDAME